MRASKSLAFLGGVTAALAVAVVACNALSGLGDDYLDCSVDRCSDHHDATAADTSTTDVVTKDGAPIDAGNGGDADAAADVTPPADASASDATLEACTGFENDANDDAREGSVSNDYPLWPIEPSAGGARFSALSASVAIDALTGYSWQRASQVALTNADALAYCASLGSGWRLPRRMELVMLQRPHLDDAGTVDTCLDPLFDPGGYFWTSTSTSDGAQVWAVNFQFCGAEPNGASASYAVRCMHE